MEMVYPRMAVVATALLYATVASGAVEEDVVRVISDSGGKARLSKSPADGTVVGINFCGASVDERCLATLHRFPTLTMLDLTGAIISDNSLRHIAPLKRLESLTLIGTRVADDGMRHLAGLTRLRHLDLTGTDVGDGGLAELSTLKDLRTLCLAGTLVTDAGMPRLRAFKDLEVLDLYGTRITGKGVLQLDGLNQLRELDLYGDSEGAHQEYTREDGLSELARRKSLPNLVRLHFRAALVPSLQDLTNWPKLNVQRLDVDLERDYQFLGKFKELRSLDVLYVSGVSDSAWSALTGLTRLESLSLSDGPVTERELAHIAQLNRLRSLRLMLTNINGKSLKLLAPLKNLRSLDLSCNDFEAGDLANLPELGALEELSLAQNPLGPGALKSLPRLDSLRSLDLSSCNFPTSELCHLQRFPKLQELCLNAASGPASATRHFGDGVFQEPPGSTSSRMPFTDEALSHLRGLKSLRSLDVTATRVTEEGIKALRRDLPGLQTVHYTKREPYRPQPAPSFDAIAVQAHSLDSILVQALIPTSTVAPNVDEARGIITQVYLGPQHLRGQSFLGRYPFASAYDEPGISFSQRLAAHELVLAYLSRRRDGILEMDYLGELRFGFVWPVWLIQPPVGHDSDPKTDYHRQQKLAEFLRTVSQQPQHKRSAFLQQQLTRGNDVEASAAMYLLPTDKATDTHLIRLLKDECVPLSRRILIDQGFGWDPRSAWATSLERTALLAKWATEMKSVEEAERLACDLRGFGDVTSESWMSYPEAKKRALALLKAVQTIQDNPKAPARAKVDAVLGFGAWSTVAARGDSFQALIRLAKDSPHAEVRGWAVFRLTLFAPFTSEEAVQVRELLKVTVDATSRQRLEQALSTPKKP